MLGNARSLTPGAQDWGGNAGKRSESHTGSARLGRKCKKTPGVSHREHRIGAETLENARSLTWQKVKLLAIYTGRYWIVFRESCYRQCAHRMILKMRLVSCAAGNMLTVKFLDALCESCNRRCAHGMVLKIRLVSRAAGNMLTNWGKYGVKSYRWQRDRGESG